MIRRKQKSILILLVLFIFSGLLYFGKTISNYFQALKDSQIPSAILNSNTPTVPPFSKEEIQAHRRSQPMLIFLKENTDQKIVSPLIEKLKQNPIITDIKYISTENALSIYRETNKNNKTLLEMMPSSLPASIQVYINSSLSNTAYKQLTEKIKNESKNFSLVTDINIPER